MNKSEINIEELIGKIAISIFHRYAIVDRGLIRDELVKMGKFDLIGGDEGLSDLLFR